MSRGLLALGSAITNVFSHFTMAVVTSVLTLVISMPILVVLAGVAAATRSWGLMPIGVALFIGVLPNPGAAGLHYVASRFACHDEPSFQDHWVGLRRFAGAALRCWLVALPITTILLVNVIFYATHQGGAAPALQLFWLLLLILWFCVLMYVYPLLLRQDDAHVARTFRNALVIATSRPMATMIILPIWLGLLLLSATTGLVVIGALALAAAIQHNLLDRLLPTLAES